MAVNIVSGLYKQLYHELTVRYTLVAVNIVSGLYKQLYHELTVRYTLMAVNIVSGLYKQLYHQSHCANNVLYTEREREMYYLTTHSTHFIYGYMASDIWLRTILIVRKETRCRHIGYSYRLTARVLLYAPSHRQDNTYHGLCYTSCGAQWVHPMKDRSEDPSHHERTLYLWATSRSLCTVYNVCSNVMFSELS